ncbi:MAG: hypothetical protein ACFFDN_23590 [Candidatus Hodarchaeota archaeon]
MTEAKIVDIIVKELKKKGYTVRTEIANLYRSADIVVLDDEDKIWIIECKISNIKKALDQIKIHKLSADKVFIGTNYKNTKKSTLEKLNEAGVGLLYVMPDGTLAKALDSSNNCNPWTTTRERLRERILR